MRAKWTNTKLYNSENEKIQKMLLMLHVSILNYDFDKYILHDTFISNVKLKNIVIDLKNVELQEP